MDNFEKLYQQNRLIALAPKHCFDVTLVDFEQIVNNDFMQLETE